MDPSDRFNASFDRSLRAWEPLDGEATAKNRGLPWQCFKIYRDLGLERTLRTVAEIMYGGRQEDGSSPEQRIKNGLRRIEKWSSQFEWQERVQGFDDHYEMMERQAIERHMADRQEDYYERQVKLKEGGLAVREAALDQAKKMVEWPLTEQRIVRDEDGEEMTVIVMPAGWNKGTARSYFEMAMGGREKEQEADHDSEGYSFENLTEEEILQYLQLSSKLSVSRRERGTS